MKIVYQIKETCSLWNDGTGLDYEIILDYVFLDKETAEQCKKDLEDLSDQKILCKEYEIVQTNLVEDLKEYEEDDKYEIHTWDALESIERQF